METTRLEESIEAIRQSINNHNLKHEEDMKRILPVVEAFEAAKNSGKFVGWVIGFLVALGTLWLMGRQILRV